jgi:stearoyl-CoA desaturase (delta-9 desaturase)
MFAMGGFPWLFWGFCLPTMTLAHATFAINTVNHLWGSRRFDTIDESRNNPITAFFAVGEGWHNNHHRYQRSARNGFYWWEFDPTWYAIKAMSWVGLAWDIQPVPARIYEEARQVSTRDTRSLSKSEVRIQNSEKNSEGNSETTGTSSFLNSEF